MTDTTAQLAAAPEQLCKRIEWAGDLVALFISVDAAVALRALLAERDELAKDAARLREALTEAEPLLAQLLVYLDQSLPNGARMPVLDKVRAALTNKD